MNNQVYLIDIIGNKLEIESKIIKDNSNLAKLFPLSSHAKPSRGLDLSYKESWEKLELKLQKLTLNTKLANSTIILGYKGDPLHPFKDKFDNTIKILKLLKKYQPKKLIIQTRSSLIVLGLDALKSLGKKVEVNLYVETIKDDVSSRLTPEFPIPSDRIKAGTALKNFGVTVNTIIPLILPYGNIKTDADLFAQKISKFSKKVIFLDKNYIPSRSLIYSSMNLIYGKEWITDDSTKFIINSLKKINPEILEIKEEDNQLKLFVA